MCETKTVLFASSFCAQLVHYRCLLISIPFFVGRRTILVWPSGTVFGCAQLKEGRSVTLALPKLKSWHKNAFNTVCTFVGPNITYTRLEINKTSWIDLLSQIVFVLMKVAFSWTMKIKSQQAWTSSVSNYYYVSDSIAWTSSYSWTNWTH